LNIWSTSKTNILICIL